MSNRKERRARKSRPRTRGGKGRRPTPKSAAKMNRQERAEALNIGILMLAQRYGDGDDELANMCLTSQAAVFAFGTGDDEDVFIARARTFYQEAKRAHESQQQTIITNPSAGRVLGPDGSPL